MLPSPRNSTVLPLPELKPVSVIVAWPMALQSPAFTTLKPFDCAVLDLHLPDMSGFEVLERLRDDETLSDLPVIVFTGRELSPEEDAQLHTLARSVVVKGVESPERLLDETALFLHRVIGDLPQEKQQMLDRLHRSDDSIVGQKYAVPTPKSVAATKACVAVAIMLSA